MGLLLAVIVHTGNVQDRDGAKLLLEKVRIELQPTIPTRWERLEVIWADGAYAGELEEWVPENFGWRLEIMKKPPDQKGFVVIKRRWVVERTFAWLGRCRRLSKDYEQNPRSSEAWIYLAMIGLMVRRLTA